MKKSEVVIGECYMVDKYDSRPARVIQEATRQVKVQGGWHTVRTATGWVVEAVNPATGLPLCCLPYLASSSLAGFYFVESRYLFCTLVEYQRRETERERSRSIAELERAAIAKANRTIVAALDARLGTSWTGRPAAPYSDPGNNGRPIKVDYTVVLELLGLPNTVPSGKELAEQVDADPATSSSD